MLLGPQLPASLATFHLERARARTVDSRDAARALRHADKRESGVFSVIRGGTSSFAKRGSDREAGRTRAERSRPVIPAAARGR